MLNKAQEYFSDVMARVSAENSVKTVGGSYEVDATEYTMTLIARDGWIGLTFMLKKEALGRSLLIEIDTDNYPIAGEHEDVAQEILDEIVTFVGNLKDGKILAGRVAGRVILALPTKAGDSYELIKRGIIVQRTTVVSRAEVPRGLHTLSL